MLLVCRRCTTRYAVGLPYCPQCTSTDHYAEGEEEQVPKITQHGGPSNAAEDAAAAAALPEREASPGEPLPEVPAEAYPPEAERLDGYEAWTVEDLRVELDRRGVEYASRDRKDALVDKLRANDAAQGEAEGEGGLG